MAEKSGWKKSGGTKLKKYGIASGKILVQRVPEKILRVVCQLKLDVRGNKVKWNGLCIFSVVEIKR